MKIGDIVYFKIKCKAHYCKKGGSYFYYFDVDKPYLLDGLHGNSCTITNLNDNTSHFITDMSIKLFSEKEYKYKTRKNKLKRIILTNN